jgi:hypothetical protein
MEEVEEELSKAKQKVDSSLYEYRYDHNDSYYIYLPGELWDYDSDMIQT